MHFNQFEIFLCYHTLKICNFNLYERVVPWYAKQSEARKFYKKIMVAENRQILLLVTQYFSIRPQPMSSKWQVSF